jgi:hypothetical protein
MIRISVLLVMVIPTILAGPVLAQGGNTPRNGSGGVDQAGGVIAGNANNNNNYNYTTTSYANSQCDSSCQAMGALAESEQKASKSTQALAPAMNVVRIQTSQAATDLSGHREQQAVVINAQPDESVVSLFRVNQVDSVVPGSATAAFQHRVDGSWDAVIPVR